LARVRGFALGGVRRFAADVARELEAEKAEWARMTTIMQALLQDEG